MITSQSVGSLGNKRLFFKQISGSWFAVSAIIPYQSGKENRFKNSIFIFRYRGNRTSAENYTNGGPYF